MSRICRSMGKFMETGFHELEHDWKMRLLKTPLNSEATNAEKKRQENGKERRPSRKGQGKRHRKPPPYHQQAGGDGAEMSRRKRETPKYRYTAPTEGRRGEIRSSKKRTPKSHTAVLCHSRSKPDCPDPPSSKRWGVATTKNKRTRTAYGPVPQAWNEPTFSTLRVGQAQ